MRRTWRSNRRAGLAAVLLAGTALLGAGCASDSDGGAAESPPSAAASYPVTVGNVTLTAQPTRIVSLSPTVTEMLFAVGAGDQVIAVDDNSNYPYASCSYIANGASKARSPPRTRTWWSSPTI